MDYCFETDNWGAAFTFPWAAAGGYIKSCNEAQIKVLLCILAGGRVTNSAVISQMSGYSEADVDQAVAYWLNNGVLRVNGDNVHKTAPAADMPHTFSDKNEPVSLVESVKPAAAAAVNKKITVSYSQREMKEKAEKDAALKNLLNEIQSLQFSINGNEMAKLIELYELYKFDAASIMMVADFCRASGKCSIAYLHTVMVDWYNKGVHTNADVEAALIEAANYRSFENKIMTMFGMESRPSKKQKEYLSGWEKSCYNFELIEIAYNKCLDKKGKLNFSYIDAILRNWAEGGIVTTEQVDESDKEYKKKYTAANGSDSSYDLEEYVTFAQNYDFGNAPWNKRKDET